MRDRTLHRAVHRSGDGGICLRYHGNWRAALKPVRARVTTLPTLGSTVAHLERTDPSFELSAACRELRVVGSHPLVTSALGFVVTVETTYQLGAR